MHTQATSPLPFTPAERHDPTLYRLSLAALGQRILCVTFAITCIAIMVRVGIFVGAAPDSFASLMATISFALVLIAAGLAWWAGLFLVGYGLHGVGAGIAYLLLSFLPFVNFALPLVLNQMTTTRLRARGFKVGLLGVAPGKVRAGGAAQT